MNNSNQYKNLVILKLCYLNTFDLKNNTVVQKNTTIKRIQICDIYDLEFDAVQKFLNTKFIFSKNFI